MEHGQGLLSRLGWPACRCFHWRLPCRTANGEPPEDCLFSLCLSCFMLHVTFILCGQAMNLPIHSVQRTRANARVADFYRYFAWELS